MRLAKSKGGPPEVKHQMLFKMKANHAWNTLGRAKTQTPQNASKRLGALGRKRVGTRGLTGVDLLEKRDTKSMRSEKTDPAQTEDGLRAWNAKKKKIILFLLFRSLLHVKQSDINSFFICEERQPAGKITYSSLNQELIFPVTRSSEKSVTVNEVIVSPFTKYIYKQLWIDNKSAS